MHSISAGLYVLDAAGRPHREDDILAWAQWMRVDQRLLRVDDSAPVLWETLVFGGALDGRQRRYTSHAAAIAGHEESCALVRRTIALDDDVPRETSQNPRTSEKS